MEAAPRTCYETSSWMDWWWLDVQIMLMSNSSHEANCHCLFLAGAKVIMIICKTLQFCQRILTSPPDLTFQHWMVLRNAMVYLTKDLPFSFIRQAAEKFSQVLRDVAVRKAVTAKPQLPGPPRQQASVRPKPSTTNGQSHPLLSGLHPRKELLQIFFSFLQQS